MNVRRFVPFVAAAVTVAAIASCGADSSSDSGPTNSSEAGPGDDASSLDSPVPPSPDAGDPSFDDFEDPGGCGGWLADNAELTWEPGGAHGSQGKCQVCAVDGGGGGVMYKLVPITAAIWELDTLLEKPEGGAGTASFALSLAFAHDDGSDAGTATTSGTLLEDFAAASLNGVTKDGTRVTIRIGRTDTNGDCFYADDIRLSKR